MGPPPFDGMRQRSGSSFAAGGVLGQGNTMPLVTPGSGSGLQGNGLNNGGTGNANQCELLPSVSQAVHHGPAIILGPPSCPDKDCHFLAIFTEGLAFLVIADMSLFAVC